MSAADGGGLDPTRTSLEIEQVLAPGALLGGRYRIVELLGIGGMGMVYRARDEELDVEVAVKLLRPEGAGRHDLRQRFRRELVLARQVSHRNVVRIHDIGEDGDVYFLTMDYVAGRSLADLMAEGPLALERASAIVGQLASALDAAHREGIVHRDLKPGNVLVDADDRAYVADFGIARSLEMPGLTKPGGVVGTPDYLAPEQARGDPVDQRADIYALGLILFEMLTGRAAFKAETVTELLAQRISGRPATLAEAGFEAPPHVEAIVALCLARDPDERYASAGEIARDLAAGRAATPPWWPRIKRPMAALGVALVLGVSVIWLWGTARRPPAQASVAARPLYSVAVLPLANETGLPELEWAGAGIAEQTTDDLSESPALKVVAGKRVASTLKDLHLDAARLEEADLALVGELLDADRLVVGRLYQAGEGLRLDAELVRSADPSAPTERLSVELADTAAVPEAGGRLAAMVRGRLRLDAAHAAAARAPSPAALESYSAGRALAEGGDPVAAQPLFERAVAEDEGFAAGWLRLAELYDELGYAVEARDAAARAVELFGDGEARLAYAARALAAKLAGDPDEAQAILHQRVERFPYDTEARMALASAFGAEGHYAEARRTLEEVTELEHNHPDAWYQLGRYAILDGDARRAHDEYLVRALVIQRRLGDEAGKARVLNALGAAAQALGDPGAAEDHYRESAEVRRRTGDRRGYASSLTNLGSIQMSTGAYAAARESFEQALGIREEIGDRSGVAAVLNFLGLLAEKSGDPPTALERFRRALQIRRELGDRRALAESANNVGFAYFLLGEFDNAAAFQAQALDLYRESGNRRGVVFTTQSVGQLDIARGRFQEALAAFLTALEESRAIDMQAAEAASLGYIGRVAHYQGRWSAALSSLAEAQEILAKLGERQGQIEFRLFEAESLLEVGMDERAAAFLAEARRWLDEAPNREQTAELLRLEGLLASRRGHPEEAAELLAEALDNAAASGSRIRRLTVAISAASARAARGDDDSRDELARLEAEATAIGYLPARLEAALARAASARAARDLEAAETTLRAGLRLAVDHQAAPLAYRLDLLLAEVLTERGSPEAAAEMERARVRARRLAAALEDPERTAFESRPEVAALVG